MNGNLDMGQHSITNLKDPEAHQATYAANVKFVADAIVDNNTVLETLIDTKIDESEKLTIALIDTKIEASEEASIRAVQQENVFENLKKMMMTFIKLAQSRKTFTKSIVRLTNFRLIMIQV